MGIESLLQQNMQNPGLAGSDRLARNAMFPQAQTDKTQYAVPSQLPTSAETIRADYDAPTNAYTGLPTRPFASGGIARFYGGGTPEEERATIADLYKKVLGRDPNEGEDISQWAGYLDTENKSQGIMALADRLAQTEEGIAYGKSNPKDVFANMVALSQKDSPFASTENPYSNMRYIGGGTQVIRGGETTPDAEITKHMFQDQNGGIMTVDESGKPLSYEPGRGWYDEQLRQHPDALRGYGYRNQTYLASGPLEKTYNFNGVDVPITAQEFQVDPKTGQLITGKTGDYKPLELKPAEYDWFNDWGGPAMVVAIPALAAAGAAAAGAYGAGAAGGIGAAEGAGAGLTSAEMMGGAGGAFAPTGGASFAIEPGAAYTAAGAEGLGGTAASQGLSLKDAYKAYSYGKKGIGVLNALSGAGGQTAGTGGGYGISAAPAASQYVAFNPTIQAPTGLGIANTYNPLATQPVFLSKLSEFKADQPAELASGGIADLGGYSDGGRLLRGPGDGMSDHIPATIGGKQPARLADGEFVIPADVVSHLGNGSTDAGAKQLYKMMDNIRKARTGNPKQGKQINPDKFTPKG